MKRLVDCRFCDIINGVHRYTGIDEPVAENDEFIAIASIGAMVQGWTLILPKDHQCSMKNLYQKDSLGLLVASIVPKLFSPDNTIVAFEHGATKYGSLTGCGIDHAHLHLVPLKESLFAVMQESNLKWIETYSSEVSSTVGRNEYLFYTELKNDEGWSAPVGHLHILKQPVSQYFRKLIGEQLGKSEFTDYKTYPFLKVAEQTRSALIHS